MLHWWAHLLGMGLSEGAAPGATYAQAAAAYVTPDRTGTLTRYVVQWQADTNGDCVLRFDGRRAPQIAGRIVRLVTIPGVTYPPTTLYDITLVDQHATDMLGGVGANRSATATEEQHVSDTASDIVPVRSVTYADDLRLTIANAGAGGSGLVVLDVVFAPPRVL